MTANWGDKLVGSGRPDLGVGTQLDPASIPEHAPIVYSDFSGGLDLSGAPEDIAPDRAVICLDMEVSNAKRLIRAPGLTLISALTRFNDGMFQNASLYGDTQLVILSPPFMALVSEITPAVVSFVDITPFLVRGFYPWAGISVLGKLIFSDLDKTYYTSFNAYGVSDITAQIGARTFGAAFGRLFAGAYSIGGGNEESMGIKWNDASGDPIAWTGLGSGSEILIPNSGRGDRIVSIRGIGFDLLAVMCRTSIWFGRPTRVSGRPADFRMQYAGVGALNEQSVAQFEEGIVFLSDQGITVLTPGSVDIVSGAINNELLPVLNNGVYQGIYDPQFRRYILTHPALTMSWVYEFPIRGVRPGRCYKRSWTSHKLLAFTQTSGLAIDAVAHRVVHSRDVSTTSNLLIEDYASSTVEATTLYPTWRTPYSSKSRVTDQFTTVGYEVEYVSSATASVSLKTTDMNGDFLSVITRTLPSTAGAYKRYLIHGVSTGLGIACEIRIESGSPQIARITQLVQPVGTGLLTL